MSILHIKSFPLKQLCPLLLAPFSTSIQLSVARKTPLEKLRELEAGEALLAKSAKTSGLALFLSQFNGDKTTGRQKYTKLSAAEKREYGRKAAMQNADIKLSRKEIAQVKRFNEAKASGALDELKVKALAHQLPKRPPTVYSIFVKENYAKQGSKDSPAVISALSKEWSSLSDSQKQLYRKKAKDIKKQNDILFNKWAKSLSEDERALFVKKGKKYLTNAQRTSLSPITAHRAFMQEYFASIKGMSSGDRAAWTKLFSKTAKEANRKWSALSDSQRQAYMSK